MFDYDNLGEFGCITCDECAETLDLAGSWSECMAEAREVGWRVAKAPGGGWKNFCPECVDEFAQKNKPV